jgi:hypothetical protein
MMGAVLAEMMQGREHPSARAAAPRLALAARAAALGYLPAADRRPPVGDAMVDRQIHGFRGAG